MGRYNRRQRAGQARLLEGIDEAGSMRFLRPAALALCMALCPAAVLADSVSLRITDPKDGFKRDFGASWERTAAARERYWLCDRPLWVAPGVGHKITRAYQSGAHVDVVAVTGEAGEQRVICALAEPGKADGDKGADKPAAK
jgi:hypothetical protein